MSHDPDLSYECMLSSLSLVNILAVLFHETPALE